MFGQFRHPNFQRAPTFRANPFRAPTIRRPPPKHKPFIYFPNKSSIFNDEFESGYIEYYRHHTFQGLKRQDEYRIFSKLTSKDKRTVNPSKELLELVRTYLTRWGVKRKHTETIYRQAVLDRILTLVSEKQVDINYKYKNTYPLGLAIEDGDIEFCKQLINIGALIKGINANGKPIDALKDVDKQIEDSYFADDFRDLKTYMTQIQNQREEATSSFKRAHIPSDDDNDEEEDDEDDEGKEDKDETQEQEPSSEPSSKRSRISGGRRTHTKRRRKGLRRFTRRNRKKSCNNKLYR